MSYLAHFHLACEPFAKEPDSRGPLSGDDTARYVRDRLRLAGADASLFGEAALQAVYLRTAGAPYLVNVLCENALNEACRAQSREVSADCVAAAADHLGLRAPGATAGSESAPSLERTRPPDVGDPVAFLHTVAEVTHLSVAETPPDNDPFAEELVADEDPGESALAESESPPADVAAPAEEIKK